MRFPVAPNAAAAVSPQTVAQVLLRYLELEGVDRVFGIPGAAIGILLVALKNEQELEGFKVCGIEAAPQAVLRLLEGRNLSPQQIGLIGHQASQSLFDAWIHSIRLPPHHLIQTIKQFANMTVANNAVNLANASTSGRIPYDHLVLLSLGPDMHANALLLSRG